jgi:single-strand selective monofunctional uracil DNA glycosylase
MVKDWLGVKGDVGKPVEENPSRIIQGLACSRSEVSGTRFWTLFKQLCGTPDTFFKNCYVHNYCPFCFMTKTGKNVTPPSLKPAEKAQLQEICDKALFDVVRLLEVEWVVGVGKYGADRAKAALKANCAAVRGVGKKSPPCCGRRGPGGVMTYTMHMAGGAGKEREVHVCSITHPSPINPAARAGWAELVKPQLSELGILDIITAQ